MTPTLLTFFHPTLDIQIYPDTRHQRQKICKKLLEKDRVFIPRHSTL